MLLPIRECVIGMRGGKLKHCSSSPPPVPPIPVLHIYLHWHMTEPGVAQNDEEASAHNRTLGMMTGVHSGVLDAEEVEQMADAAAAAFQEVAAAQSAKSERGSGGVVRSLPCALLPHSSSPSSPPAFLPRTPTPHPTPKPCPRSVVITHWSLTSFRPLLPTPCGLSVGPGV